MNYLTKAVAISLLRPSGLEENLLIGLGGFSVRLPFKDFIIPHKHIGLHLLEHDSTVSVHFCLLESICLLSSCS